MFTDGMTDCRDPKSEPFGFDRIKSVLRSFPIPRRNRFAIIC
ncbi:MAG: hypothetical protein IPL71_07610 [Anaerolineales bacterium]|nr:hypothetical protein [Anaerolineales bacterium]